MDREKGVARSRARPGPALAELYSHSRLSSFESCPKKFHYRYVEKIPSDTEGVEGFVGKRVHEVLERLYRATSRGRVPTLQQVVDRFHRTFDEQFDPVRVRIVRDQPAAWYRSYGARCLANYYREHYPFDGDETLGLEERVVFALDPDGAYRMNGIVDRIARTRRGAVEIHDFKTSQRVPSQAALDEDRQLALYQIGVSRRYPDAPISLVWHYLGCGAVRRSTRTPEQLDALRERTVELIDRIRAETDFEARPSPLCRWCEYADRCPAGPVRAAASARVADADRPVPAPPSERVAARTALPRAPVQLSLSL